MEERCQWLLQQLGLAGNPALARRKCPAANDANGGAGIQEGEIGRSVSYDDLYPCPSSSSSSAMPAPSSLSDLDPTAPWIPVLDIISSSYSGSICSAICGRSIFPSPASRLSSGELGQRRLGILRF